jgi:hypothetical protein
VAKNIYICSKGKLPASTGNRLHEICKILAPDNIITAEPKVVVNGDIAYGIMNPTRTLSERGNSLLMGQIFGGDDSWHEPLREFPDGSYALFRNGPAHCEMYTVLSQDKKKVQG